jgi:glycerophosphoryl diester phosphodiesterase
MHPFLDHTGPIAFAHRGGALEAPENTMRAFAAAVELGYSYVETDVHATADGVLLAFHDDRLDRLTNLKGAIVELPYAELARARIGGGAASQLTGRPAPDDEPIPRLDELMTRWPHLRINIDVKHDKAVLPLAALIKELDCLDRICVGSFSGARVAALRAEFGRPLCTSLTAPEVARLKLASLGLPVGPIAGQCAQVPEAWPVAGWPLRVVDRRFLAAAHERAIPVHVWTVDERAEVERLLDLGVDGLMTDRPRLLKTVLQERTQWIDQP